jgi:hypothetical protein
MRRILKISTGLISSAVLLLVIAASVFVFYINPFTPDGPFTGEPRENCDLLKNPMQVFPIDAGNSLEVYAREENDPAPTVLLRDRDNKIKWCMYAVAHPFSDVYTIEFRGYGRWFLVGQKVEGIVNWTYGYEWTGWYLSPFGGLRKYYYAW